PEIITLTESQRKQLDKRERRFIGEADTTITVNPFIAEEMAKRYRISTPHVILNAIGSVREFDPLRKSTRFRDKLSIPESKKIILYQGWFALHRGLLHMVEGMKKVAPHVHAVFMGYGEEALAVMKEKAKELDILHRMSFLDAVPQNELLSWTASADA